MFYSEIIQIRNMLILHIGPAIKYQKSPFYEKYEFKIIILILSSKIDLHYIRIIENDA